MTAFTIVAGTDSNGVSSSIHSSPLVRRRGRRSTPARTDRLRPPPRRRPGSARPRCGCDRSPPTPKPSWPWSPGGMCVARLTTTSWPATAAAQRLGVEQRRPAPAWPPANGPAPPSSSERAITDTSCPACTSRSTARHPTTPVPTGHEDLHRTPPANKHDRHLDGGSGVDGDGPVHSSSIVCAWPARPARRPRPAHIAAGDAARQRVLLLAPPAGPRRRISVHANAGSAPSIAPRHRASVIVGRGPGQPVATLRARHRLDDPGPRQRLQVLGQVRPPARRGTRPAGRRAATCPDGSSPRIVQQWIRPFDALRRSSYLGH